MAILKKHIVIEGHAAARMEERGIPAGGERALRLFV